MRDGDRRHAPGGVAGEIPSVTFTPTVTGTSLPVGGHSDEGVGRHVIPGGVASRWIVTDSDAVPIREPRPALGKEPAMRDRRVSDARGSFYQSLWSYS